MPSLPSVVTMSEESFDRNKMYEDGSYAKFITEVAMIFATGREAHIDKKLLAKDINDMIELEKLLDDVRFYTLIKRIVFIDFIECNNNLLFIERYISRLQICVLYFR